MDFRQSACHLFYPIEIKMTKFKQQQAKQVRGALRLRLSSGETSITCFDNLKYVTGQYTPNNQTLFKRPAYGCKSIAFLSMYDIDD